MTTFRPMSLKSVASREDVSLTPAELGYFAGLAQREAHSVILKLFLGLSKAEGLTRAFVARRINKRPEQITRWLGEATDMRLGTYAELLASLGYKPVFTAVPLDKVRKSNEHHPLSDIQFAAPVIKSAEVGNGCLTWGQEGILLR